jgi:AcrR family transcriptional regulator
MRKAQLTRDSILEQAWLIASREGLTRLTLGTLAARMRMSKSGVFVHFGSIEALQILALDRYAKELQLTVFESAARVSPGLSRLRTFFQCAVRHFLARPAVGCLYVSGAFEYADRPGQLRRELVRRTLEFRVAMAEYVAECVQSNELAANTVPEQVAAEMYGLLLLLQSETRLHNATDVVGRIEVAFEALLKRYDTRPREINQAANAMLGKRGCETSTSNKERCLPLTPWTRFCSDLLHTPGGSSQASGR